MPGTSGKAAGASGKAGTSGGGSLGRDFRWLWAAYGVSVFGTRFAFDAFALIAILTLHASPAQVSLLSAAGLAVGAVLAVPLGPWVEFRRKRPVMVAMDLTRCAALLTVPIAYALDVLTFAQLLAVSVLVAAADIAFTAASGAFLRTVVHQDDLLTANARMESTTWTATALGPPLGGAAVGMFGPVVTVAADAASHLLSAAGIRAITTTEPRAAAGPRAAARPRATAGPHTTTEPCTTTEPRTTARPRTTTEPCTTTEPRTTAEPRAATRPPHPEPVGAPRLRPRDLAEGWRTILADPALRPLFLNTVLVSALIMAAAPPLAVLMLGPLGFAPWQYGLAFALPCVGGLIGSRLSRPLIHRFGEHRVLRTAGTLRACWSLGLALVHPGPTGLALVVVTELGLITCMGVFNPVYATYRLNHTPPDRLARTLAAWTITSRTTVATLTALTGLLATLTTPRTAIATAGALLLATPLLLPRGGGDRARPRDRQRARGA